MDTSRAAAPSAPAAGASAAPPGTPRTLRDAVRDLHAGPALAVALLAAEVAEDLHRSAVGAPTTSTDPRHPWQRVVDRAHLVRAAGSDPCRALAFAARERALCGEAACEEPDAAGPVLRLVPDVDDAGVPDDPALDDLAELAEVGSVAVSHSLRLDAALRVAELAGAVLDRRSAERYVRDQASVAVLMGAEPDDVPEGLAELGAVVDVLSHQVRAAAGPLPAPASLTGHEHPAVPAFGEAARLVAWVLPEDLRPHALVEETVDEASARAELARMLAEGAQLR